MDIAALIVWILTAGGGSYLLRTWLAHGGARSGGATNLPAGVVFGHFLLAAAGLVVWIVYVVNNSRTTGWIAFALLALVAILGFGMFARWLPTYRGQTAASRTGGAADRGTAPAVTGPAERHFPVPVVAAHGVLAAATLVLVLLAVTGAVGS